MRQPARQNELAPPSITRENTLEVASYIAEVLAGLRELTGHESNRDLAFLNYAIAMAEEEAKTLSARRYN